MNETRPESEDRVHPIIRVLDKGVVALVHGLLLGAKFRARDPRERLANLLAPDPRERVHTRGWEAVLQWSPQKRVGCFTGVAIGIAIGGAILWYGTR